MPGRTCYGNDPALLDEIEVGPELLKVQTPIAEHALRERIHPKIGP